MTTDARFVRSLLGALLLLPVALLTFALTPASAEPKKPFQFFSIQPDRFGSYPACDSPEGADHICMAGEIGAGLGKTIFMELRPEKPKYLTSNIAVSTSANGKPSLFHVRTGGATVQQQVFDYLQISYGRPTAIKRTIKQNAFGAQIPAIIASWTRHDYTVEFNGIADRLDEGEINAFSMQ